MHRTLTVALALCGFTVSACGVEASEAVYVDERVVVPTPAPLVVPRTTLVTTGAPSPLPALDDSVGESDLSIVVFDRLSSPQNAIAEIVGTGAAPDSSVTVDGEPVSFMSFEGTVAGRFVARVFIAEQGAHTVCVEDTCGRVFTLDPDAESLPEVEAKIEAARTAAALRFDGIAVFPEWRIVTAGPFSGVGGSTDVRNKTIVIHANRDRAVEEFERTIIHEWGHVFDHERLTDEERAAYLELRGIDPATPWTEPHDHSREGWFKQPSEDFAEVIAMWLSDGAFIPRTGVLAATPDNATLEAVAALVEA